VSEPTQQSHPASPGLKAAWILLGFLFVISLVISIAMIVETLNWVRLHGPTLPEWFHPLTTLSEWTLALSALGLFALAILTVIRRANEQ
jgi:MFS superfamily sulfate permease-like transporter